MTRNPWILGSLLVLFLILVRYALEFWRRPEVPDVLKGDMEGFEAPSSISACRCLPGYQPVNQAAESDTPSYICQSVDDASKKRDCY